MAKSQAHLDIAKIKIAMKQLNIPDDDGHAGHDDLSTYRAMLKRVTGKTSVSTTVMSDRDRRKVLQHLERLGFRPNKYRKRHGRHKAPGMASDGQIGKLRFLWGQLRDNGALDAGEKASIDNWVAGATLKYNGGAGYGSVDFLPKQVASKLIEELKQWCIRLSIPWR